MMTLLGQAFALATRCHQTISQTCTKIQDTYDSIGCVLWRMQMDDKFFALDVESSSSPFKQKVARLCNMTAEKTQHWAYENMSIRGAGGDFAPRPDIKPGLINAAQACVPYVTKNPVMMGAMLLTMAFAAYAMTHAGIGHGTADVVGTIYGASPNGKFAPKPD